MPPQGSGDPGDGDNDDDLGLDDDRDDHLDADGRGPFRHPLHPDDRLWRHPSEVAAGLVAPRSPAASGPSDRSPAALAAAESVVGRARPWGVALVSGLIGATLSLGVAAALGGLGSTRVVEQQVAVQPLVQAPHDEGVVAVASRTKPALARLETAGAVGTAVVWRSDGYLITSAQLVGSARRIQVTTFDGTVHDATVIGVDPVTDIAVVKVDADDLTPATFGSTETLEVGALAVAVGASPDGPLDVSVTTGVISAMGRRLQHPNGTVLHEMMLVDAPVAEGSAGGALVDRSGSIIGLTTGIPVADDDENGMGAATPVDVVVHIAAQLMATGSAQHVWLGVEGDDVTDRASDGPTWGAAVQTVLPDSPARAAGLEGGDVIVGVDGEKVASMTDLIRALRSRSPGESVVVTLWRPDGPLDITVVLAERR